MEKICSKCKISKDVSEFHVYKRMKDGLQPHCKKCINNIYATKPMDQKKKDSWVEETKKRKDRYTKRNIEYKTRLGGQCLKCGDQRLYVLDYHHLDPEKKVDHITDLISKNLKLVEEEIVKCILLCACCHREFHHLEKLSGITTEEYLKTVDCLSAQKELSAK